MGVTHEILEKISSLCLRDLLEYVIAAKLSGEALSAAKRRIYDLWLQNKYGFTPSKEEAIAIQRISQREIYKRLKGCIGKHWALDLLRVGIYISELNEVGSKETVERIKEDVYNRFRARGVRILTLGSTGIIVQVIEFLSDLKSENNLNEEEIGLELDRILDEWDRITIFVKRDDPESSVLDRINRYIEQQHQLFFVFTFGRTAFRKATKTIAKLNNDNVILDNHYLFDSDLRINQAGDPIYTCLFRLISEKISNSQG